MPRLDIRRARRISAHDIGEEPMHVGRSSQNELVLRNIHVSRRHCVIERVNGELRLRDLESQSGTFLNGERITQAPLFAGDRISIGPYDLFVRAAPDESAFISRNAALDAALNHVHIDDETGIPLEGPAALVESLKKQIEADRRQYEQAAAQIAVLHRQVEDLESKQIAHAESLPLSIAPRRDEDQERALAEALARAEDAERRLTQLQQELEDLKIASISAPQAPQSLAEDDASAEHALAEERARADDAERRLAQLQQELADMKAASISEPQAPLALPEDAASAESSPTERQAALEDLDALQREVAALHAAAAAAEQTLQTERAHAADLNRALEEAWAKIEHSGAESQSLQDRFDALESRSADALRDVDAARADRDEATARLATFQVELMQRTEDAGAARQALEDAIANVRQRLETSESALHHALARADDMEGVAASLQERLAALQAESIAKAEQQASELAERDQQLADLRSAEAGLAQRLNNLEATKYAASEKAERALKTLNLLQGQIRSLDDAAARVNDLQSRLAQIEEAWVDADETLEQVDESNEEQLTAAVEQRQRVITELDALNKARDAAVSMLRDSAMRLRSLAEREPPAAIVHTPPAEPATAGGSRKWWKLSK